MFSTWLILNCFVVLLSGVIRGINGANSSSNSSCVIDYHVTNNFYLCLDHKYYECYPHNHNSTKGKVINITNSSSSGSSGSSGTPFTYINYINGNKLLEKAGCYYISKKCPSTHGMVMLSCNSNNYSTVSGSNSNGKNCVVTETNNVTKSTNQLICSVIINANNKDYYYAFIAVIVLIIVLFCLCPICCLYHFCRYCQENEFYESYNGRKSNKSNNKSNNKKSNVGTTTSRNNNKCEDVSSEDRTMLFSTNMKTTTTAVRSEQQIEAQPINKSSMSRDGFCSTNANDEIVVWKNWISTIKFIIQQFLPLIHWKRVRYLK